MWVVVKLLQYCDISFLKLREHRQDKPKADYVSCFDIANSIMVNSFLLILPSLLKSHPFMMIASERRLLRLGGGCCSTCIRQQGWAGQAGTSCRRTLAEPPHSWIITTRSLSWSQALNRHILESISLQWCSMKVRQQWTDHGIFTILGKTEPNLNTLVISSRTMVRIMRVKISHIFAFVIIRCATCH